MNLCLQNIKHIFSIALIQLKAGPWRSETPFLVLIDMRES